jgi:hypothetical protein
MTPALLPLIGGDTAVPSHGGDRFKCRRKVERLRHKKEINSFKREVRRHARSGRHYVAICGSAATT